jgi:phospholipase/carboxylesterase
MNTLHAEELSLKYLVRQPKLNSPHPPAIILLHGIGSNEADLFSFADQLPGKFLVISARAPITLAAGSYAWYQADFSTPTPTFNLEQENKSRLLIKDFIQQIIAKYSVDPDQIFLVGFSQGAIMSYSVGLTNPGLVNGIAIMSGRMLEEIKPLIQESNQLKNLHIFISHGVLDNTLRIQFAREAVAYLHGLKLNPEYKEYSEGHGINSEMFSDLLNWLNSISEK